MCVGEAIFHGIFQVLHADMFSYSALNDKPTNLTRSHLSQCVTLSYTWTGK